MARQINWDEVPDFDIMPKGTPQVRVDSVKETETGNGYLMYNVTYKVVAPETFAGRLIFDRFTVGSERFPNDWDPLSFGTGQAKKLLKAANVVLDVDPDRAMNDLKDAQLIVAVEIDNTPYTDKNGVVKSQPRNRISRNGYYGLGEKEPRFDAGFETVSTVTKTEAPAGMSKRIKR